MSARDDILARVRRARPSMFTMPTVEHLMVLMGLNWYWMGEAGQARL